MNPTAVQKLKSRDAGSPAAGLRPSAEYACALLSEQDAKAYRAVSLNGKPLVPPDIVAPDQVNHVATQRLHELRARVAAALPGICERRWLA